MIFHRCDVLKFYSARFFCVRSGSARASDMIIRFHLLTALMTVFAMFVFDRHAFTLECICNIGFLCTVPMYCKAQLSSTIQME